jgi:3-oxoacyl-[acyl-carrier-protein] synthase-3
MKACIAGIEIDLPERVVTNADLAREHPDWDMDKIADRTGVLERHVCADDETALDIGQRASERLFERLNYSPDDVGGVIFCTQTPDYLVPGNSGLLQDRLNLRTSIPAFDITHGCSGYVYGLFIAESLVLSGAAKSILLVNADSYLRLLHPDDRSTVPLLGDGGAASLICAVEGGPREIGEFSIGTDGRNADIFMIEAGGARVPRSEETCKPLSNSTGLVWTAEHVKMEGLAVLAFVYKRVPQAVKELLAKAGHGMEAVDLVVPHQASALTLENIQRWLKLPDEKCLNNMSDVGNLASASIPVALRKAELDGRLRPGMKVMLVAYGVGLSWGACLVDW